jgi:hypothetical protein
MIAPGVAEVTGANLDVVRGVGHTLVGGALAEAQGGDFMSGALGSAVGYAAGSFSGRFITGGTPWDIAARTAIAAVAGGTAAELSGGKFVNGAATAAFQHLFNQEAARKLQKRTFRLGGGVVGPFGSEDEAAISASRGLALTDDTDLRERGRFILRDPGGRYWHSLRYGVGTLTGGSNGRNGVIDTYDLQLPTFGAQGPGIGPDPGWAIVSVIHSHPTSAVQHLSRSWIASGHFYAGDDHFAHLKQINIYVVTGNSNIEKYVPPTFQNISDANRYLNHLANGYYYWLK